MSSDKLNQLPTIFSAVIAAGGEGTRFGGDAPKQFLNLEGIPIVIRAVSPFARHQQCHQVIVAVHPDWREWMEAQAVAQGWSGKVKVVVGGSERGDSVLAGLRALDNCEIVLIHDAVRPFISEDIISQVANAAEYFGAAAVAVLITDTVKREKEGFISTTIKRDNLWRVQTPQAFRLPDILQAYELARSEGFKGTDDCVLVEKFLNLKIKPVPGSDSNIKITTAEDMVLARLLASI